MVPAEVLEAAQLIRAYFARQGIKEWAIGGVQSRIA
jgi:hypothetical protein